MNALIVLALSSKELSSYRAKSLAAGLHAQNFASGNGLSRPVQCASAVTIAMVLESFQLLQLYLYYSLQ